MLIEGWSRNPVEIMYDFGFPRTEWSEEMRQYLDEEVDTED